MVTVTFIIGFLGFIVTIKENWGMKKGIEPGKVLRVATTPSLQYFKDTLGIQGWGDYY